MSEIYRGGEQQQQVVVAGMGDGLLGSPMMSMYHVPQQSRREKLRYPSSEENPLSLVPTSTTINPHHLQNHSHLAPSSSSSIPLQKSLNGDQHHNIIPRPSPMEPFTGYAAVLDGSKFLIPTQNMLAELCDVGLGRYGGVFGFDDHNESLAELQMVVDQLRLEDMNQKYTSDAGVGSDQRRIKAWLISTLNEVYKVCKQYLHQLKSIISAFESVAGLSNAAPYASLAMESMSRHFCRIKDAICDHLCYTQKAHFQLISNEDSSKKKNEEKYQVGAGNGSSYFRRTPRPPTPLQGSSANNPRSSSSNNNHNNNNYVWRPQRGLPEKAVAVLKAWLFEHFLHPYPTDTDKHMLAKQTGLTRNQVSNWFINARVRLWKPMVEEIHSLEQRQSKKVQIPAIFKTSSEQQQLPSPSMLPSTSSTADLLNVKQASNATHFFRDVQNALSSVVTVDIPPPCNFSSSPVDTCSRQQQQQQHTSNNHIGGYSTGVSLTLGLQQNNTTASISESIPLNVARHFGFEDDYIPAMSLAAVGKNVVNTGQQQFLRDFIG